MCVGVSCECGVFKCGMCVVCVCVWCVCMSLSVVHVGDRSITILVSLSFDLFFSFDVLIF